MRTQSRRFGEHLAVNQRRDSSSVPRDPFSVFVNVPFDDAYSPLLDAIIFAITACGYRIRCALEDDDSGDIRLDKLARLIGESPRSIRDLSRIELGDNELPRFNMPFELGMALGAKRFGGKRHASDKTKIMLLNLTSCLPTYRTWAATIRRHTDWTRTGS